jgi:pyrroline-5-carboxylate reductase
MRIGFIGCGNMASALARGWSDPVVCSDVDASRAQALAAELGGEAVATNAEVAAGSDAIVLCHKPGQLGDVAGQVDADGKVVLSLLGGVPIERVRGAYPGARVYRFMPNIAVAIRRGAIGLADDDAGDPQTFAQVRELLGRVGTVVVLPESQLDIVTSVAGVGPAYVALIAEAWVDAAVRRGMPAPVAEQLVAASLVGSSELLAGREMDTLGIRREVSSPGGVTAAGLRALERGGLRTAIQDAVDAVLEHGR